MSDFSIFQKFACGIMICKNDTHYTIAEANDAAYLIMGYTKEEMETIHGNRFSPLLLDNLLVLQEKVRSITNGEADVLDYEYRIKNKNGEIIWIHDLAKYHREEDVFYVTIMNITYKANELEEKSEIARRDSLTGLLNRYGLTHSIEEAMEDQDSSKCMFLIDLDNFKNVNDSYGHIEGDKALSLVSGKLTALFETGAIVGRLGGDEFVVFLMNTKDREVVSAISKQILSALTLDYKGTKLSCSIGVVWVQSGQVDFQTMYAASDAALYEVKNTSRSGFKITIEDDPLTPFGANKL